jgi:hypothetical protein
MGKFKGRVVRPNAFARRSLAQLHLLLRCGQPSDWPQHLFSAWQIVNGQLGLSESEALSVILHSVSAAHRCVAAENQCASRIGEVEALKEVRNACERIRRRVQDDRAEVAEASAKLRRRLDEEILPLIRQPTIDLEVIQSIFETAAKVFDDFPVRGPSLSNLLSEVGKDYFSNLGATLRRELEQAIADFGAPSKTGDRVTAEALFKVLAEALPAEDTQKIKTGTHRLRSHYIAEVAKIWRRAGLKPFRSNDPWTIGHRGRFHCFAEFVLTAIAEPQTRRHDGDNDIYALRRATKRAHDRLTEDIRPLVSLELSRVDRQWLTSDDHLKRGLSKL